MYKKIGENTESSPGHDAPEVVQGASDLIPVSNDYEAPEAIIPQYQHYQHLDAQSSVPSYSPGNGYTPHEKRSSFIEPDMATPQGTPVATKTNRRKRMIWIIVGVILLLLAIGLGVGLGVGLSQSSNDNNDDNQRASQPTTTTTQAPSSTSAAPITAGTTGLAQYSCDDNQDIDSDANTRYVQYCGYQYQQGRTSYYNQSISIHNLAHTTLYTFRDCLAFCDNWNDQGNDPACRAVTYYGNITAPIAMWGGNCFLKNDRGQGYRTDDVDWEYTVSAYQNCLNVTCSGAE